MMNLEISLQEAIFIAISFYDDSLIKKLNYWTEKTDAQVYNVAESRRLIEVLANKTDDKSIKLPILSVQRPNGFRMNNSNKHSLTHKGLTFQPNDAQSVYQELLQKYKAKKITKEQFTEKLKELQAISKSQIVASLNAIPISIPYKLSVYTRYQEENDIYIRNLLFNLINYPIVKVSFKYNSLPVQHDSSIIISDNNVSNDSSDITLFNDQICKQSISFIIDDAYLWNIELNKCMSINNFGYEEESQIDTGMWLHIANNSDDSSFIVEEV